MYIGTNKISVIMIRFIKFKKRGLNIILTPHLGGCAVDAMYKTEELIIDLLAETLQS